MLYSTLQKVPQAAVRDLGIKPPNKLAQDPRGFTPVPEPLPMWFTHEPHTGPGFVQHELSQEKCTHAYRAGVSSSLSAMSPWKQTSTAQLTWPGTQAQHCPPAPDADVGHPSVAWESLCTEGSRSGRDQLTSAIPLGVGVNTGKSLSSGA